MTAALQNYQARMQRVLDHIDRNLDGELDLDALASVAAFSKFHFHRQFSATFELSVHRYVQLARLKRASHQLTRADAPSITQVAMDAGYDAPDAFARAFRARFGQSPSSFRKSPDWGPWFAAFRPLNHARSKLMQPDYSTADVTIRTVDPTPVAIMAHRGDRATLIDTIQRFIAWRKAAGLSPLTSATYNIFRSERSPAVAADYAMDICVETEMPIAADDPDMTPGVIPGGRCAVMRIDAASHNLEPPALYLYRDWLPASGEEARDFPLYCRRWFTKGPDGPEQAFGELFLPLK